MFMWVRILTKRQASALRSEVAKLHNGSFTLRISNCKNRFNCFSVCLHQTSAFAERTDNFVTGPEVVGSSNPGSSIQNKDNKFMQLYTNLKNSSKFDRHLFIEGSQILQMLTDTAEISLCKEALMRHASLGGEFASLSPTQVLSCVASLGGLIRGNENDYILINQVIQLGAASRVGSNTVHGSTNISDFLRAFISLKCVHSHEGVASSLVSAILLPPLQSFASAGKGLSSADVCLAMSAVQWMLVSDPSTEQYLQTLLTIVGQSDSIPSENDVCRSFKYICNLRHFSTVADSVNVGLIRKLAQNLNALTTAGATKILNRLCGFSGDVNNLKCILSAIAPILPLPGMQMTPSQIGRAMYGLQKLKADTRDEQLVVRWLTGQMMTTPKGKCFTAGDISRCMVGMRSMDASFLAVQALMESVERGLYYTHGDMTAIQIATCFDCIRGKGRQANTRTVKLVEALTSHLVYFDEESGKILTAGFISMIVNGVSDLGLKEPCVRRILAIVDKHLQRSQDSVTEKNIKCNLAGILYATRNWSIDSQNSSELKALLHTVGLKLAGMRRIMGGYELAKCLYGLNSTNNKSKEVQNLLSVLNMQLSTAESTSFEGVHIGRGLYGLKSMSNYYPGALAMLDSLTAKLKDCDERFSARGLYMCVCAVSNMTGDSTAVREFLNTIREKVLLSEPTVTSQDIYNLLHCCKHISSSIQEFNDVLDTFTERYALCSLANDEGSLYANHPLAVLFLLSNRFEFTPAIQRLLQVIVQKLELVNSNITDNYILSGNRLDLVRERIVKAFKGVDQYPCSMVEISLLMKVLCTYASTVQLSPRNACEILSSLSNKRCDNDHMLKFLSKIRVDMTAADTRCMIAIPPHMACSALGGLSATCCGSEEINMLLYEICHIINRDRGALNGKDIAIAISGIRNMNLNCAAVNNVLALLTTSMRDGKNIQFRSLEIIGIISSVNTMYQRKAEETSSPDFELPKEIKRILQVLAQRTMPSRQQFFGKKEVITQLKNMSILQLFKCGEVNGLRVSLRRKGML